MKYSQFIRTIVIPSVLDPNSSVKRNYDSFIRLNYKIVWPSTYICNILTGDAIQESAHAHHAEKLKNTIETKLKLYAKKVGWTYANLPTLDAVFEHKDSYKKRIAWLESVAKIHEKKGN